MQNKILFVLKSFRIFT